MSRVKGSLRVWQPAAVVIVPNMHLSPAKSEPVRWEISLEKHMGGNISVITIFNTIMSCIVDCSCSKKDIKALEYV